MASCAHVTVILRGWAHCEPLPYERLPRLGLVIRRGETRPGAVLEAYGVLGFRPVRSGLMRVSEFLKNS